jgi:hypothetical protein
VVTLPLNEKLDMLWGFIKTHKKNKVLVFVSSCKQVTCISNIHQNSSVDTFLNASAAFIQAPLFGD